MKWDPRRAYRKVSIWDTEAVSLGSPDHREIQLALDSNQDQTTSKEANES